MNNLSEAALLEQVVCLHLAIFGRVSESALMNMSRWAAALYYFEEDSARAAVIQSDAINHSVELLGADHPDTLTRRVNGARYLASAGRLPEAIDQLEVVLRHQHAKLDNRADALHTLAMLADAQQVLGNERRAKKLRKAVERRSNPDEMEQAWGGRDSWLTEFGRLAFACRRNVVAAAAQSAFVVPSTRDLMLLGLRAAEAELLSRRIDQLGESHPETQVIMNDLSWVLGQIGELQEARELQEKVVAQTVVVCGENHFRTANVIARLASLMRGAGDFDGAMKADTRVVNIRRSIFGDDDDRTFDAQLDLAEDLMNLDRAEEAVALAKEVYESRAKVLGLDNPKTSAASEKLGRAMLAAGDAERARDRQREVVELRMRTLGTNAEATMEAIELLAECLHELGEYDEAVRLEEQLLLHRVGTLGNFDAKTIATRGRLAGMLDLSGQSSRAIEVAKINFDLALEHLGDDSMVTALAAATYFGILADSNDVRIQEMTEAARDHLARANIDPLSPIMRVISEIIGEPPDKI
jgi:tetratricopeptide (TPR) repeat protein